MTLKPHFDWPGFAAAVKRKVEALGSYDTVCAAHPGTNKGMLSRACTGRRLSLESALHLSACLGLNPFTFYDLEETVARPRKPIRTMAELPQNQGVTVPVSREASTDPKTGSGVRP